MLSDRASAEMLQALTEETHSRISSIADAGFVDIIWAEIYVRHLFNGAPTIESL